MAQHLQGNPVVNAQHYALAVSNCRSWRAQAQRLSLRNLSVCGEKAEPLRMGALPNWEELAETAVRTSGELEKRGSAGIYVVSLVYLFSARPPRCAVAPSNGGNTFSSARQPRLGLTALSIRNVESNAVATRVVLSLVSVSLYFLDTYCTVTHRGLGFHASKFYHSGIRLPC
jgi:hypothetical protein